MDRQALRQILRELIEDDLGEPVGDLDDQLILRENLGLDSVSLVTLVIRIQDRFKVFMSNEELEKVIRVADFLDLLQGKMALMAKAG